ncbi:MAG: response regulator [Planctomycetota bacterium]|nr:response regulator [Planctomycetota bacterium]
MIASLRNESLEAGLKILLVEDNFLVAHDIHKLLVEFGHEVAGPVASVREGVELARDESIQAAILDINLVDGDCAPIADQLRSRHCPFIFITGFGSPSFAFEDLNDIFRLKKPIKHDDLQDAICEHLIA